MKEKGWTPAGESQEMYAYNFALNNGGVIRTKCRKCRTWIAVTPAAYCTAHEETEYPHPFLLCKDCGGA